MERISVGAKNVASRLVPDEHYRETIELLCAKAKLRVLGSLFIIDIASSIKDEPCVAQLLEGLAKAVNRGVDVRLIIGGSQKNLQIQDITEASAALCGSLGVPCKVLAKEADKSSHKKVTVIDDFVLLGSHNWSGGAFTGQVQDSVLFQNKEMAAFFASQIMWEWNYLR